MPGTIELLLLLLLYHELVSVRRHVLLVRVTGILTLLRCHRLVHLLVRLSSELIVELTLLSLLGQGLVVHQVLLHGESAIVTAHQGLGHVRSVLSLTVHLRGRGILQDPSDPEMSLGGSALASWVLPISYAGDEGTGGGDRLGRRGDPGTRSVGA